MRKIGIYGGTFDPIHHGHLILARAARERLALEKMIFVPAAVSPHKVHRAFAPAEIRLEMLRAAIEGEPSFEIDECELRRSTPSYTIDTVLLIRSRQVDAQIFYLIGEDNLANLPSWHRFKELRELVQFVVLHRSGFKNETTYPMIDRSCDISATEIRKRVATGDSIRYFVPPAVDEIIRRAQLYREMKK